ncbi:MAG: Ig domain-containing protein, partial [Planctomycetota bacterium]
TVSGTPAEEGTFTFTVQAVDSSVPAKTVSTELSVTISPEGSLIITSAELPDGVVRSSYTTSLEASGGTPVYYWQFYTGTLPPGLSLSSMGTLSGTPTTAGEYQFTVQVSDSSDPESTATAQITITIQPAPLEITTTSLPNGGIGLSYLANLTATGGTTPYSWSIQEGSLPAGLSLSDNGTISGTPSSQTTITVTFLLTDSSSPQQTDTVTINLTISTSASGYNWTHRIGGTSEDDGRGIHADEGGNIYITGGFQGEVDFANDWDGSEIKTSAGNFDAFVTKIDAGGEYCWSHRLGGSGDDRGLSLWTDSEGNSYTIGYFNGTVNFAEDWGGEDSKSNGGAYITKIDIDGFYGWTHRLPVNSLIDINLAVCTDNSGNIFATGVASSANYAEDWGGSEQKTAPYMSSFVTKINADGSYGWTKIVPGTSYSICTDSNGNIFITGGYYGPDANFAQDWGGSDILTGNSTEKNIFITKINADGRYGWSRKIGAAGLRDCAYGICSDINDNIFLVGTFGGIVNFGEAWGEEDTKRCTWLYDVFITKIDSDDNYYWSHRMSGFPTDYNVGWAVCADRTGNCYTIEYIQGNINVAEDWNEVDQKAPGRAGCVMITKANADNTYGWTRMIHTGSSEYFQFGNRICADGSGNIYVTGLFSGTVDFAEDWDNYTESKTSAGATDVYIMKIR